MTNLVNKLVQDLIPGDKVHDITEAVFYPNPRPALPLTVLSWDPTESRLTFRAHRGRTDLLFVVNPALNVRVARRHRPRIVEVPERNFQIKNNVTGEVLQCKEMTTRGPGGERLYKIRFGGELWSSDSYTDLKFKETLGTRWEVVP